MKTKSVALSVILLSSASMASACPSGSHVVVGTNVAIGEADRALVPNERAASDATPREPMRLAGNTACNPRVKVCEE